MRSTIPKPFGKKLRVSLWDHQVGKQRWEKELFLPHPGNGGYASFDRQGKYMIVRLESGHPFRLDTKARFPTNPILFFLGAKMAVFSIFVMVES